jgi:hypothetical protein
MRRPLAALVVAAVVVAPGWSDAEPAGAREPVGVFSSIDGGAQILARLAPSSLRPGRPRLRLGEYHEDWSFSPDGSQLALGMGGQGDPCGRGICIVDAGTMRIAGYVHASIAVEAIAWLRPRRIVAVLQRGGVIVADPVTETVVRSRDLPFQPFAPPVARTSEGLAVVMRSRPPQLVVVNAHGDVRSVALRRIERGAALAAARRGARAFVTSARGPTAEVSLRTMGVRYHRLPTPHGGQRREALWLGHGRLAVSGDPTAGVTVIDTSTWTARTVAPGATSARLAGGRLLVYSEPGFRPRSRGVGLRMYTRDGRRLVRHLFGDRKLEVEVLGEDVAVFRPDDFRARATEIVRARTGALVRTVARPPRGYEVSILSSPLGSGELPR